MGCISHSLLIILLTATTGGDQDLRNKTFQQESISSKEYVFDYAERNLLLQDISDDEDDEQDGRYITIVDDDVTEANPINGYCPADYEEIDENAECTNWTNICYSRKLLGFPYSCEYFDYFKFIQNVPIDGAYYISKRNPLYGYYEILEPGPKFRQLVTELSNTETDWKSCAFTSINEENYDESCTFNYNIGLDMCNSFEVYSLCFYDSSTYNFCDNFRQICGRNCDCATYQNKFLCESREPCTRPCDDCLDKFKKYPLPHIILLRSNSWVYVTVQNILKIAKRNDLELHCFSENPHSSEERVWRKHSLTKLSSTIDVELYGLNTQQAGLYWCEYFTYPDMKIEMTEKFVFMHDTPHSYILNTTVFLDNTYYTFIPYNIITSTRDILLSIFKVYEIFEPEIDISIVAMSPQHGDNLINLTYRINRYVVGHFDEIYYQTEEILKDGLIDNSTFIINFSILPASICPTVVDDITNLLFPATRIGRVAVPDSLIVDINGLPILRRCLGSHIQGAFWSDFNRNINYGGFSTITEELSALLNSTTNAYELNVELRTIIEDPDEVIPFDLHLIAEILTRIVTANDSFNCREFTYNINEVMRFPTEVLLMAQQNLNSTDAILYNFDLGLGAIARRISAECNDHEPLIIISDLVLVQIVNIKISSFNGMAVYKKGDDDFSVQSLEGISSFQQVNLTNLIFASYLPPSLRDTIISNADNESCMHLVIALYLNDALFNEEDDDFSVNYVVSMFINNVDTFFLNETIPVYFNVDGNNLTCAYWRYGLNQHSDSIYGSWVHQYDFLDETSRICNFNHMTHFSLLINAPTNKELGIISYIASFLSIIGAFLIVLTGIIFIKWREQSGTIVLLNYSVTVMIQHILLLILDTDLKKGSLFCQIIGIATHYIVLVQFCWMLVISYVQYLKLVIVYANHITPSIIQFCLFSWLIPILPVALVVYLAIEDYKCFLGGYSFYFAIVLPISIIILFNFITYVRILYSLFCSNVKIAVKSNEYKKVSVSIILYFLMGFTWIFGLVANFFTSMLFSYLFSILTATHGLTICVYFILLQKYPRRMWVEKIRSWFGKENYKRTSFSSSSQ